MLMNRRDFSKTSLLLGIGTLSGLHLGFRNSRVSSPYASYYEEPAKKLPVRNVDVVVAGGGTAGIVAALASARQGAKTLLIEHKGYVGGTVVEGGTALHSFYNLWKAFPEAEKRQVVKGIPREIIDRLMEVGGCTGHAEMSKGYDYDSVCTAIDTELYKLVTMEMLDEAGVMIHLNTRLVDVVTEGSLVRGVITESRSGREAVFAKTFVDCTAYGDLAHFAGGDVYEKNDYPVCNSIGMANVNIDRYHDFLKNYDAIGQMARGIRSGKDDQIVRLSGWSADMPEGFKREARAIGMSMTTTTVHDNYLMFVKINMKMDKSPTDRDAVAKAELDLRKRQYRAVELFRKYIPGCADAFMARTSPHLTIRRARVVNCDYELSLSDITEARHFDDEVMVYGFHDSAPRYQVKDGGTYGIPYRALLPKGLNNLLVTGMMITSGHEAHMSTRNTVCCMGQGQGAGTAAALCAEKNKTTRDLNYSDLRPALEAGGVYFES